MRIYVDILKSTPQALVAQSETFDVKYARSIEALSPIYSADTLLRPELKAGDAIPHHYCGSTSHDQHPKPPIFSS